MEKEETWKHILITHQAFSFKDILKNTKKNVST